MVFKRIDFDGMSEEEILKAVMEVGKLSAKAFLKYMLEIPETGVTKAEFVDFYANIGPHAFLKNASKADVTPEVLVDNMLTDLSNEGFIDFVPPNKFKPSKKGHETFAKRLANFEELTFDKAINDFKAYLRERKAS